MKSFAGSLTVRRGLLLLLACCVALPGCGRYAGLAYFLGMGRKTKIPKEFDLPEGLVLVLVDDPAERVEWPRARNLLERYVGEELLEHETVESVISPDSVARFRRSDPDFDMYATDRVGSMLGADTVIWLEVREFSAPINIEDTSTAAKMTVAVRVLTTHEDERASRVRLWPSDAGGYIAETTLNAVEVHRLKGDNAVAAELARRSAIRVGRLFRDYTVGEADDERI